MPNFRLSNGTGFLSGDTPVGSAYMLRLDALTVDHCHIPARDFRIPQGCTYNHVDTICGVFLSGIHRSD
jgi:hypothetical protein